MKKYKKDFGFSYAIGVSPTLELLQTRPDKIQRILIRKKGVQSNGVSKIEMIARNKNVRMEKVESIAEGDNCYTLAIFNKYQSKLSSNNHLVLVNPSDKGNLGTIIRSMTAFNVTGLAIIKPGVDIFDPKVIRSSMGALFRINFEYFDNFKQYRAKYRANNFYPFMTDGKYNLQKIKFRKPFSLVFGNEGEGLGKEYLRIGESVKIPQDSLIDSLNLSVAAGIGLYASYITGSSFLDSTNDC